MTPCLFPQNGFRFDCFVINLFLKRKFDSNSCSYEFSAPLG
jgi:hypothetical protein